MHVFGGQGDDSLALFHFLLQVIGGEASRGEFKFVEAPFVKIASDLGNKVYANRTIQFPGGGIYVNWSLNVSLTNNDVYSNSSSSTGGGIYIR